MPNRATSARCLSAIARRAAYISPEASPADSRMGVALMNGRWNLFYEDAFYSAGRVEKRKTVLGLILSPEVHDAQSLAWSGDGSGPALTSTGKCNSCSLYCSWYSR